MESNAQSLQNERNLLHQNGEQEQGGISPIVYVFKILHFWPYLVVALVLGLAGAFVYNRYAQPVYKINSSLLVIENKGGGSAMKNLDAVLMSGGLGGMTSTTDNELGIIQSFTLVDLALKELDFGVRITKLGQFSREEIYPHRGIVVEVDSFHPQLVDLSLRIELQGKGRYRITENGEEGHLYDPLRYTYKGEEAEPEMVTSDIRSASYAFGQWVEGKHHRFRLQVLDAAALSGSNFSVEFRSHRALQDEYFGKVEVEPWKKMASLLYLTLEEVNIEKGKRYLNKLMEVYLRQNLELKNQTSLNTVGFIDRELSGISDSLQTTESRLEQFRSANRTVNISSEGQVIFSRLEEYEKSRALEQGKLKYYDYLRNYLSENRPAGEVVSPSTMGVQDPVLIALIQELGKLSGERNAMAVGTRRSNPYLEQLDEKIRLTNSAIRENLRNLVQNSQILIRDLEGRIRSTEGLMSTLPRTERDLVNIKRKFTLNENLFVYLLQKRAEAGITMAANLPDARVIDAAKKEKQVAPNKATNYVLGGLLGLLLPIAIILIRDSLQNKAINYVLGGLLGLLLPIAIILIRDSLQNALIDRQQIESVTRVPVLGVIGNNNKQTALVVLQHPKSVISESFRALRTNMQYINPGKEKQVVLITSSISGEGKTFISTNIASVLALSGKKTVLIGMDLRKPKIFNDFGLTNNVGMSNYLIGKAEKEEIIQHTNYLRSARPRRKKSSSIPIT